MVLEQVGMQEAVSELGMSSSVHECSDEGSICSVADYKNTSPPIETGRHITTSDGFSNMSP